MLRLTLIALTAALALGASAASAAPFNGSVIGAAAKVSTSENGAVQQVWGRWGGYWGGYRHHHHHHHHHRGW